MYAIPALSLAAALFASSTSAAPLTQRDLGAPFNLTYTIHASDGTLTTQAPLASCHTGAGTSVLCSPPGGIVNAGTPFNFNSSGDDPLAPGYTSSGSLLYEEFMDTSPPIYQGASFTQAQQNAVYGTFGDGVPTTVLAFNGADYLTWINNPPINNSRVDSNFYLCPYSNTAGYNYNAVVHVPLGEEPEASGCTAVGVVRVF